MTTHTHLQLNVCKDMHLPHYQTTQCEEFVNRVYSDISKAYGQKPDTIVFNEMETDYHQKYALTEGREDGYGRYVPAGSAKAVVLAWRWDRFSFVTAKSRRTTLGRAKVTPNRYINKVVLKRRDTGETVTVLGTQAISGGFNMKVQATDPWRRLQWHLHMTVLRAMIRYARLTTDYVVWSGDLNRNHLSFGLGQLPNRAPTHGHSIYDYVGVTRSNRRRIGWRFRTVKVLKGFFSDHNGVLAEVEW